MLARKIKVNIGRVKRSGMEDKWKRNERETSEPERARDRRSGILRSNMKRSRVSMLARKIKVNIGRVKRSATEDKWKRNERETSEPERTGDRRSGNIRITN